MSKGELEDKISKLLSRWEKDYLGRGSLVVKTDILRNMVIVVLKGVLTPAEEKLVVTQEGLMAIKRMRSDLVESGVDHLYSLVEEATGTKVTSFFTDISTRSGERVMVFMMDSSLD